MIKSQSNNDNTKHIKSPRDYDLHHPYWLKDSRNPVDCFTIYDTPCRGNKHLGPLYPFNYSIIRHALTLNKILKATHTQIKSLVVLISCIDLDSNLVLNLTFIQSNI